MAADEWKEFLWYRKRQGYFCQDMRRFDQKDGVVDEHISRMLMAVPQEGDKEEEDGDGDEGVYPLTDTALFFEFAETEPTEAGILGFANRYGPLTEGEIALVGASKKRLVKRVQPFPRKDIREFTYDNKESFVAEPVALWQSEITHMRRLIDVWLAVLAGDTAKLVDMIRIEEMTGKWAEEGFSRCVSFPGRSLGHNVAVNPKTKAELYNLCARELIKGEIEESLDGEALDGAISVSFEKTKGEWGRLRVWPATLQAGLWIQFAHAVTEQKRFNTCEVCGKKLEVSETEYRSNRTLCSDACKSKAYRRRRQRAQELRQAGKSYAAIAKEIGSDTKTVTSWLKKNGESK